VRPFLLAQISDPHLGEPPIADYGYGILTPRVIAAIAALPDPVDALLVTGDLAEHADPKEYALAAELIGALGVPFHVLPGNKDDRATMRRAFDLPGEADAPIDYAVDLGPLRLVVVDSTIPGEDRGDFDPEQLEQLDAELAASPTPTIVAMHHPPLTTGLAWLDEIGHTREHTAALADLLREAPNVVRVVAGHVHRTAFATLGGCPVTTCASTNLQAKLEIGSPGFTIVPEPPAFLVHTPDVAHVQPVGAS